MQKFAIFAKKYDDTQSIDKKYWVAEDYCNYAGGYRGTTHSAQTSK